MMHQKMIRAAVANLEEMQNAGLLIYGRGCRIDLMALFRPEDHLGSLRPIVLGERVVVGAGAVIHGGTVIGDDARVGHHVILGEPEHGYAIRDTYPGHGGRTLIGEGAVLRAGAVVYAETEIGDRTTIGHHTMLRTGVVVGRDSQLAANITVERRARIGAQVRCSPGSHLTGAIVVEDGVFIGAGVRTINDKEMIWRDDENERPLSPPCFRQGARIGTGAVILNGVEIGQRAFVGAGSIVTRDVPDDTLVYGVPASPRQRITS